MIGFVAACHWVSEGTVAVLAVTSRDLEWEGIDTTAHEFQLPHLVTPDTCSVPCDSAPLVAPQHLELVIFEYLKDEFLHDIILLHEGEGDDGTLLAYLMNMHSVRMSHLQATEAPGFLKTVERSDSGKARPRGQNADIPWQWTHCRPDRDESSRAFDNFLESEVERKHELIKIYPIK
ncbi:uncharacterized protein TNIN_237471 [Trichonephila inaurata madagascariensis]|uniref:Uncharacterized protein n=1 Tax=Trichonephila inaurata madagascariensis TaxID=2747483 RepID=A0A8X6KIW9_9ARAC|nr:uncharacterized protein TNIN_237471 [Trichonephila inaurata madagascariensis]